MTHVAINSLGYVEVRGLAAAIETADSMLKCAEVRLLRQLLRDPAQITLTVEGQLGACRAAVDAGQACAMRLGAFVSCQVLGRPARDTEHFVLALAEAGRQPFGEMPARGVKKSAAPAAPAPATPDAALDSALDSALIAALADLPGGYGVQALSRQLGVAAAALRARLEALVEQGLLAKRRGRYHRVPPTGGAQ